jgi:hypothetical protein
MTQQGEEAPRPIDVDALQLRQAIAGTRNRPTLVPPSVRRGQQAAVIQGGRTTPTIPGGPPFTLGRPGRQTHVPRAFQRAATAGRAGAAHGATTVAAQYSVDYPDDLWFLDANGGWMKLDTGSENGLELMNAIVSDARRNQRPLYYDTDDTTGNVVDVYVM